MRYKFKCDVNAMDCWKLSMYRIYHSMVGVCSLIFAVSVIAMTVRFWDESGLLLRILMMTACLLVPVVQPLGAYIRSVKQTSQLPKNMELWFSDKGIYVQADGQTANIGWNKINRVIKQPNMVMILVRDGRGYMLTDRVLGKDKDEFYEYLGSRIS
ncbi:MAG: YcxB family protein [Eubacteriales bacterium]|nr:YcxB family protein [Eubacteriales bacterium]